MKEKAALKLVISMFVGLVLVCIMFYYVMYLPIERYIDTHTWATITVRGMSDSDTNESFVDTAEHLKGDTINVYEMITLSVDDITHDGTVDFSVTKGELYDEKEERVFSFSINKKQKVSYKMKDGTLSVSVNSSRYQ